MRKAYALMYLIAAGINTTLALRSPEVVRGLSRYAYFGFLRQVIAAAPTWLFVVALLSFVGYQLTLVALLLNRRHYRLGLWGGLLFHLAIIPFGPFNLFNLVLALPLILKLRREDRAD